MLLLTPHFMYRKSRNCLKPSLYLRSFFFYLDIFLCYVCKLLKEHFTFLKINDYVACFLHCHVKDISDYLWLDISLKLILIFAK